MRELIKLKEGDTFHKYFNDILIARQSHLLYWYLTNKLKRELVQRFWWKHYLDKFTLLKIGKILQNK